MNHLSRQPHNLPAVRADHQRGMEQKPSPPAIARGAQAANMLPGKMCLGGIADQQPGSFDPRTGDLIMRGGYGCEGYVLVFDETIGGLAVIPGFRLPGSATAGSAAAWAA